jgi:phage-related protein
MNIASFLGVISSRLIYIGTQLLGLGLRISGVYLIGQYLSQPFYGMGNFILQVALDLVDLAKEWNELYHFINIQLGKIQDTSTLTQYASRLIAFILNPIPTLFNALRELYPKLDNLVDDTYNTIYPLVVSIIHSVLGTVTDIATSIRNVLTSEIQDYSLLRFNAGQWVFNHLVQYAGNLASFLRDPEEWVIERIRIHFPDLMKIIENPTEYILEKVIDGIERMAASTVKRLAKIFETILSDLF